MSALKRSHMGGGHRGPKVTLDDPRLYPCALCEADGPHPECQRCGMLAGPGHLVRALQEQVLELEARRPIRKRPWAHFPPSKALGWAVKPTYDNGIYRYVMQVCPDCAGSGVGEAVIASDG